MTPIFQLVLKHGYSVLFGALFAHQIGLPVPGLLFLLAAGTLAAAGKLNLIAVLILAVTACVLGDWPWYEAGRRRGEKVLHSVHCLTSDPDFHDRRAKKIFARYGPPLLLVAKFVPGLDAVTPPLAGTSRTSRFRFMALDAAGAALYSSAYAGIGYLCSRDLERAADYAARTGGVLTGLVIAVLAIFIIRKLILWKHAVPAQHHGCDQEIGISDGEVMERAVRP